MTTSRIPRLLLAAAVFLAASTAAAAQVTDVRLQNTGTAAQTAVPITFGQVFVVGDVKKTDVLTGSLAGAAVPLQVDVKATHTDGSVRHAIISAVVPKLPVGTTPMQIATGGAASSAAPASFRDAAATANVTLTIAGVKYTASLADALATTPSPWLAGPVAAEIFADAPLKNAAGAVHPLLTAKYGLRWYPAAKAARVEVIVENTSTFRAPARNFTYDVSVDVAGRTVYSKAALTHYHHARWHQYFWTGTAPAVNVQPNTAYLIASKAVSNYDTSTQVAAGAIVDQRAALTSDKVGPMTIGTAVAYMGMTGGRGDIGLLPDYSVMYLLSGDQRVRDVMMANADGSGSWSIHYRDEVTGDPLRTDTARTAMVSTHPNLGGRGPLPVPRCAPDASCDTPYADDVAHLPSLTYLPYLLTGDLYYLDELHFWASSNPLGTDPGYNGNGQGLMRWHQLRGQAWSMRTLGQAAYATPDASPMKAYFGKQLDANLNFYNQTYPVGNPNKLGVYDGSGEGSMPADNNPPWQDDFFTSTFGYLTDLGFEKARPVLVWKAKYPVGRMTADGYDWITASAYYLKYKDGPGKPIYSSFAELYRANFGGTSAPGGGGDVVPGLPGVNFADIPFDSKAQADYLAKVNNTSWVIGQMIGYPSSALGFPSNLQPALAAAVDAGVPNAVKAWSIFMGRTVKPDYSANPQWNIIPRGAVAPLPPVTPPVVVPPPAAKPGTITTPSSVTVAKKKCLTYRVFALATLATVSDFTCITPSSANKFTLKSPALIPGAPGLAGAVIDPETGLALTVQYPLTVK